MPINWILGHKPQQPLPSWKLWGRKDRGGLFSYFCPPMDPEVTTKSTLDIIMGNIADVVSGHQYIGWWGDEIPKEMWLHQQCTTRVRLKMGVDVLQSLMKAKDFFKAQKIFIWKQIKVQRKLNFATLCLHVKENYKTCEESDKACEESCKVCKW